MAKINKLLSLFTERQFIIYALIGAIGVTIDIILYVFFTHVLGIEPLLSNFLAISIAIANNFILNRKFNFKVNDKVLIRFLLFYATGLVGIILSELLLIVLHYILGIDDVISKILTLPFILIFQFFLNKHLSFGSLTNQEKRLRKFLFHWPAYVLTLFIFLLLIVTVKFIPSNFAQDSPKYAPDERAHYIFNVEFIAKNKQLPVSGRDDLEAYRNCRDNPSAKVPCLYSYTYYPAASYVINAASSSLLPKISSMSPTTASRIPSVIYGLIFVLCIYFSSYLITRSRLISSMIMIGIGLIPQFIFVSSYTNLDAHSIAISGLLGLVVTFFFTHSKNRYAIPLLGIVAGGLLPLAKYNFFVLLFPLLMLVFYAVWKKVISKKQVMTLLLWGVGSFVLLASGWYIRNYILYGDIAGQNFAIEEMSKHHSLGISKDIFDVFSHTYLVGKDFFQTLYKSFYVNYGAMAYPLNDSRYIIPAFGAVVGLGYLVIHIINSRHQTHIKRLILASTLFISTVSVALSAVVYNSLVYDFQPQGRYLFPILICLALFLAYAVRTSKKLEILVFIIASTTVFIAINGLELFIKVYMNA